MTHSTAIADSWDRITIVTQDTSAGCPPSNGMLSAMNVESLSAINGMRKLCMAQRRF